MTSPMINNIMLIGAILCYTSAILYGIDSRFVEEKYITVICSVSKTTRKRGLSIADNFRFCREMGIYTSIS